MKRKLTAICMIFATAFAVVACQSSDKSQTSNTKDKTETQTVKERIANSIPDRYDDYGETKPADYYVKADGFDYDYNSLNYKLVWSDEFDYEGLPDESKWTYDIGKGQGGWGNGELQKYTDKGNAWVKDGKLTIELKKEQDEFGKDMYTSARIKTKGKADFLYGKFEIKAKLPKGKGTWPAIWMLPSSTTEYGGWPMSGEIDIMEHVGYLQNIIHSNVHCQKYNGLDGSNKGWAKKVEGVSEEFHTYGFEWLPDKLIFTVDGETIFTYDPDEYVGNSKDVTKDEWPFDKEFHLIMNVAYGGSWGGSSGTDDECLPQQMQVDYVRVYQSDVINALAEKEK